MSNDAGRAYVMDYFDHASRGLTNTLAGLVANPEATIDQARNILRDTIMDRLPYLDAAGSFMGNAVFFSACYLSVWLVLKDEGVDVHEFGAAILSHTEELPTLFSEDNTANWPESPGTHSGEFEVEFVLLEEGYTGHNITSCGECKLYAQFDAMDLMPYMCATDDYNDSMPPGLRRTATIALGHDHCDFRFRQGDNPTTLAQQYPEQIRWVEERQ